MAKHLCTTCTASALSGSCTDRIYRNRGNIDGYGTEGQSVVACPEYLEKQQVPHGWDKIKKGRLVLRELIAREAWGVIRPDGTVLVDSHFKNEATAWQVALGWSDDEEIEEAKAKGYRAELFTVVAG